MPFDFRKYSLIFNRLPQQKITCELPSIDVSVSDARLMLLVALLTSIPFPESEEPPMEPLKVSPTYCVLPIKNVCQFTEKQNDSVHKQFAKMAR